MSDNTYIDEILSNNGLLSQSLSNYKERKSQIQMAKYIDYYLKNNKSICIEAPTGCGKSIAYLIPSIYFSIKNNVSVVVATANKALQHQIIEKDLPFLKETLDVKFTYGLIKGRNNYICNKKIEDNMDKTKYTKGTVTDAEHYCFKNLLEWYDKTEVGDISEFEFEVVNSVIENNVINDNECTGRKCKKYSKCFSSIARNKASTANIIIVNYHILLLDLKLKSEGGKGILPVYEYLVLDEAHKLIDISRDFFSICNLNKNSLRRTITNYIEVFKHCLQNFWLPDNLFKKSIDFNKSFDKLITKYKREIDDYSLYLGSYFKSKDYSGILTPNNKPTFEYPQKLIRIIEDLLEIQKKIQTNLTNIANNSEKNLKYDSLEEKEKKIKDIIDTNELLLRIGENIGELKSGISTVFTKIIENPDWNAVNLCGYITSDTNDNKYGELNAVPIYLNEILNNVVFSKMKSTVACSATLKIANSFDFFKNSTGFTGDDIGFKSEFDLQNQMTIIINTKSPDPSEGYNNPEAYKNYIEKITDSINVIINHSKGGTLILATSIKNVKDIKDSLSNKSKEYKILSQYDNCPVYKTIDEFRNNRHTCLVGAASLWEGIDVVGDSLNSVFICKLPFKHINDPIVKILSERGENSFMNYILPMAIIAFKQGVGRLIRSEMDNGIVYIADSRVYTNRNYGWMFLEFFTENGVQVKVL